MSTLVPPLGTPFNTILHFSDNLAYLPNTPQHSRQIHQRDQSSPRSPSNTIQSGQTVSSILGPSIILLFLLTYSQKFIRTIILMSSWLTYLVNLQEFLILIRPLVLTLIQEELKPTSLTLLAALSLTSLIIYYSNIVFISIPISCNLT